MPEIPVTESIANRTAFNMPNTEVGGSAGLLLAMEQMLGGVAPSRQSPFYFPIDSKNGIPTAKSDPRAAKQGITPLKPSPDMVDGAQLMVNLAMAETNSQDSKVLRPWLEAYLKKNKAL